MALPPKLPAQVPRKFPVVPDISRSVQDEFRQLRTMLYDTQDQLLLAQGKIQNLNPNPTVITGPQGKQGQPGAIIVTGTGTNIGGIGGITPATGDNPNVTQLLGILAQAQRAYIPAYTTIPDLQDPASQNGSLASVGGILYRFDGSTQPGIWKPQAALAVAIIDTHANRIANYPAANYPSGTLFYETDTELLYVDNAGVWVNISGPLLLEGTHSSRLASTPSVSYAFGTAYYETDRTVRYWVQNAAGTATVTTGTTVTWTSGDHFINTGTGFTAAQWPAGTPIIISGVTCHVATVSSSTVLTLQAATTNGAGVGFLVPSGRWVYLDGQYAAALASIPTDLGENDSTLVAGKVAIGFLFYENALFAHQLQWNATLWQRGPNDEEHSDSFHEFGAVPTDLGWQACNGSTVSYLKYDGTTANRTVPSLNATAAYAKGGGSYSNTLVAPVVPTISGVTNSQVTGITVSPALAATAGTGTADNAGVSSVAVLVPPFFGGGGGGGVTDGGHAHAMSAANAPIALPGDPVENFSVVKMYRR